MQNEENKQQKPNLLYHLFTIIRNQNEPFFLQKKKKISKCLSPISFP